MQTCYPARPGPLDNLPNKRTTKSWPKSRGRPNSSPKWRASLPPAPRLSLLFELCKTPKQTLCSQLVGTKMGRKRKAAEAASADGAARSQHCSATVLVTNLPYSFANPQVLFPPRLFFAVSAWFEVPSRCKLTSCEWMPYGKSALVSYRVTRC